MARSIAVRTVLDEAGHSEEAKEAFERNGVLIFDPKIDGKTVDRAIADVELGVSHDWRPFTRRTPPSDVGRVTDAWSTSASVNKIALASAVLEPLGTPRAGGASFFRL